MIGISRIGFLLLIGVSFDCFVGLTTTAQSQREKTITRVFWQDNDTQKLSYADLSTTDKWHIKRGWISGFPEVDDSKFRIGNLQQIGSSIFVPIVGQNKNDAGGIVVVDSGVFEEPHGNHFHWKYTKAPTAKFLNLVSGSPSAIYVFGKKIYVPNSMTGFLELDPLQLNSSQTNSIRAFRGGQNAQLAVVDNSICYATWNSDDPENADRVDVVDLRASDSQVAYSFKLPNANGNGNTKAITTNSGKVFFAHDNGVSWINADHSLSQKGNTIDTKMVAGSADFLMTAKSANFINDKNWVLYSAGSGAASALCMINAASANPKVNRIPVKVEEGLRLSSPKTKLSLGKRYAFMFQERIDPDSDVQEKLTIVELDPNRDLVFTDAQVKTEFPIGKSKFEAEQFMHSICFDAYGRFAIFTSPFDGLITIMTLNDMKIRARFKVGGTPGNIAAVGAPEHFH